MQPNEETKARDTIRRYIRHRPERFVEARQWLLETFPPSKAARKRSSPSRAYRRMEKLVRYWRDKLSEGRTLPPSASCEGDMVALRIMLTSWLLDSDGHPQESDPVSARRKEYRDLPHLDTRSFLQLSDQFALRVDPRWVKLVAEAVETSATYEVTPSKPAMPERMRLAGESYEWVCEQDPDLALATDGPTKKHWEHLKLHGSPMYPGRNSLPVNPETWLRYVREFRAMRDGLRNTPRAGRPHGKSVVDESDI